MHNRLEGRLFVVLHCVAFPLQLEENRLRAEPVVVSLVCLVLGGVLQGCLSILFELGGLSLLVLFYVLHLIVSV